MLSNTELKFPPWFRRAGMSLIVLRFGLFEKWKARFCPGASSLDRFVLARSFATDGAAADTNAYDCVDVDVAVCVAVADDVDVDIDGH